MRQIWCEIRFYFAAVVLVLWLIPDTGEKKATPETIAGVKRTQVMVSDQNSTSAIPDAESEKVMHIEFRSGTENRIRKDDKRLTSKAEDLFPQPNHY